MTRHTATLVALVATAAIGLLWSTAHAGPPLICHPVEIGDADSIPWGDDAFKKARGYSKGTVVEDTVRVLDRTSDPLVHMETLRRATLYVDRDEKLALRLMNRLLARALDAEMSGTPDALAWFDAGYLAQAYEQMGIDSGLRGTGGAHKGVAGYGWVRRAIAIRPDDAGLEFGAAMVTALAKGETHERHVERARALSDDGSLVARNLEIHSTRYWPHHHARRG